MPIGPAPLLTMERMGESGGHCDCEALGFRGLNSRTAAIHSCVSAHPVTPDLFGGPRFRTNTPVAPSEPWMPDPGLR